MLKPTKHDYSVIFVDNGDETLGNVAWEWADMNKHFKRFGFIPIFDRNTELTSTAKA